jgi:hypothetical protein
MLDKINGQIRNLEAVIKILGRFREDLIANRKRI